METIQNNSKRVGECFDTGWDEYLQIAKTDVLRHSEMFAALDKHITREFGNRPFTIADFGCGDASAIWPLLAKKHTTRYIGVDAAPGLIEKARMVLKDLTCEKDLICADMRTVATKIDGKIDIVVASYALHHLGTEDKKRFILDCKEKLSAGGSLILIDGVLAAGQNRAEWLLALEARIREACPSMSSEQVEYFLEHPRSDDFPDSIATFREIAKVQGWGHFEVVIDRGIFAMLVFKK